MRFQGLIRVSSRLQPVVEHVDYFPRLGTQPRAPSNLRSTKTTPLSEPVSLSTMGEAAYCFHGETRGVHGRMLLCAPMRN